MTKAEVIQMLSYAEERIRTGWYYGNRKQFDKRHDSIVECLTRALKKATSETVAGERK